MSERKCDSLCRDQNARIIQQLPATLQRSAVHESPAPEEVPPIVYDVLRSPGQPLDDSTRTFMESRFGQDFSGVRIHTDSRAAESAAAVNANAYTVGQHIAFDEGQYRPTSAIGQYLLVHELTHVAQHSPNISGKLAVGNDLASEAEANVSAQRVLNGQTPVTSGEHVTGQLHRQARGAGTQTAPAPSTPMTRTQFESVMRQQFGVTNIHNGTFAEQAASLTRHGQPPADAALRPQWQAWDPGPSSPIYQYIVDSFRDFLSQFGAIPQVTEIIFYHMHYEHGSTAGTLIPRADVGASFGATTLTVYSATTTLNKGLPMGRGTSTPHPNPPVAILGNHSTPGSPIPAPSRRESVSRIISHELGHGVGQVAALASARPREFFTREYGSAVGWVNGQLFDIGQPSVALAIKNGTPPPAQYHIEPAKWNDSAWIEQPISDYMVEGGPGEDFAEAIMAYVNAPQVLRTRSPCRYRFIDNNRQKWLPLLQRNPGQSGTTMPNPAGTVRQPTRP